MSTVLAISAVELRRFLRDRSNLFFVFVFPLLLVLFIGLQFGSGAGQGRVVLVGPESGLRSALATELDRAGVAVSQSDAAGARDLLARERADVGVVASSRAAADYRAGRDVTLEVLQGSSTGAVAVLQTLRGATQNVVAEQGMVAALEGAGVAEAEARAALGRAGEAVTPPRVEVVDVDEVAQEFAGATGFEVGAAGQTLLFVFLTSLTGATTLIQSRRLGATARTLAAPVSTTQVIAGQTMGRFAIAFFQGAYIMAGTALVFGVDWGNLLLAVLVLAVFAVVSAGAAMVIGSVMDNEGAASGVGVGGGLVLAALGGAMMPLEIFPDTLRSIAHLTPHAWAYDAFASIQRHEGTLVDVLPQLAVLAAMAAGLLVLGAWLLRRSLERAV